MTDAVECVEYNNKRFLTLKEASKLFLKSNPNARIKIETAEGKKTEYKNYESFKQDLAHREECPTINWGYTKSSYVRKIVPKISEDKNKQLIVKFVVSSSDQYGTN